MQTFTRLDEFSTQKKATATAIGNFDGIHMGHQHILQILGEEAQKKNLLSLVLTFSPHPERFLGKKKVRMIQTIDQRLRAIKKNNISMAVVLPFSQSIANLSSREFIKKIMIDSLGTRTIIVGENFRFGRNREGNIEVMEKLSSSLNFDFSSIPARKKNGNIISSSLIRTLLLKGEIEEANRLLGHPYEIEGTVIQGQSRGINLGFPTANVSSANEILPEGVFLSKVNLKGNKQPALTNIGRRPTFQQKKINIESHIIGFSGDLYGRNLEIQFLKKLRDEKKFETAGQLAEQIARDVAQAKKYFKIK